MNLYLFLPPSFLFHILNQLFSIRPAILLDFWDFKNLGIARKS